MGVNHGGGVGTGEGYKRRGYNPPPQKKKNLKQGSKVKKHPKIVSDGKTMGANTRGIYLGVGAGRGGGHFHPQTWLKQGKTFKTTLK